MDFDQLQDNLSQMERRCKASWDNLKVIAKHEMKPALKQKMSDFLKDCAERIIILKIVHRRIINRYDYSEGSSDAFFYLVEIPSSVALTPCVSPERDNGVISDSVNCNVMLTCFSLYVLQVPCLPVVPGPSSVRCAGGQHPPLQ